MPNPFDVLPAHVRRYVYALLALAALALAAYRASEGDWFEFAYLLLGSLGFGQATAKTPSRKQREVSVRVDFDDAPIRDALGKAQEAADDLSRRLDRREE